VKNKVHLKLCTSSCL